MGSFLSKCQPLPFTCYEIAHTWSPYCCAAPLDVAVPCMWESLRIYSTVYLATAVIRGRIPTSEEAKKIVQGILQSSIFLTYNAFGFVWAHCFVRHLLGFSNYWSLAMVPGWLCSFLAIFVERHSRRTMLATYVTNVASESLYTSLLNNGLIARAKYVDVVLFAASLCGYSYLYKKQGAAKDPVFTLLRGALGAEEAGCDTTLSRHGEAEQSLAPGGPPGRFGGILEQKHPLCPHRDSCAISALKRAGQLGLLGIAGQTALNLLQILRGRQRSVFSLRPEKNQLVAFLFTISLVSKGSLCALRWLRGKESAWHGAAAGLAAAPTYLLYRNPSLTLYAFWKFVEVYIKFWHNLGWLPTVPFFTELVYAASTSLLFHLGVMEPHSLRNSYFVFLNNITGFKISEVNRKLVDVMYGTQASKIVNFTPLYQEEHVSQSLKSLFPGVGALK